MLLTANEVKVMRAVRARVGRCGLLSKEAGLAYRITDQTLQRLRRKDLLVYKHGRGAHWALTPEGLSALRDVERTEPRSTSGDATDPRLSPLEVAIRNLAALADETGAKREAKAIRTMVATMAAEAMEKAKRRHAERAVNDAEHYRRVSSVLDVVVEAIDNGEQHQQGTAE